MIALVSATVTASFFDSLNPSAIAQQMLLQATVKKKRHVWFFIVGIALANYVMGIAIYFGIAAQLQRLWEYSTAHYPILVRGLQLGAGALCLSFGIKMLINIKKHITSEASAETKTPTRSLTPASLFVMGAAFCAVEITSALPYFGFLALLSSYRLAVPYVLLLILLYAFIYVAPLILLYFGYNRLSGTAAIVKLEKVLGKVSAYIVPVAVLLLGVVLSFNGGMELFSAVG